MDKKFYFFILIFTFLILFIAKSNNQKYLSKNIYKNNNLYDTISTNTVPSRQMSTNYFEASTDTIIKDELLENISILNNLAKEFKNDYPNLYISSTELCLQFIRKEKYSDSKWTITAGAINEDFINYVLDKSSLTTNYFSTAIIPNNKLDFDHMCASLNANIHSGYYPEIDDYAGWAGDLIQLMEIIADFDNDNSHTNDEIKNYAKKLLGTSDNTSLFGIDDLLSDMDAIIIYKLYAENSSFKDFYSIIENYYYKNNNYINNREKIFSEQLKNTYKQKNIKEIAQTVLSSTQAKFLSKIETSKYIIPVAEVFAEYFEN